MSSHTIPIHDKSPKFGTNTFMADTARVIGDVTIGNDCSFWFGTVVRGDVNKITIGDRVNIQDGVIIHCTYQKSETHIGNDVSVGHGAILHGCKVKDEVLIGMKAVVMDNAVVNKHVIVAAGAVVLENQILESGWIYGGIPAKKIKKLEEDNLSFFITRTAKNYIEYASWYPAEMKK